MQFTPSRIGMHRQTVGVDCAPGAGRSGVLDRVKGTAQAVRSIRAFGAEAGPHGWRVSAHRREDAVVPPSLLTVAHKAMQIRFDGGRLTSDAGVLVLAEIERRLRIAERLALHPGSEDARPGASRHRGDDPLPTAPRAARLPPTSSGWCSTRPPTGSFTRCAA